MKISTRLLLVRAFLLIQFSALAATVTITVGNNFYATQDALVRPGDNVVWQWQAGTHPTAFDANEFSSFLISASTTSHSITIPLTTAVGTIFKYHCSSHAFQDASNNWQGMIGSLNVVSATPAEAARPTTPTLSVYPNPSKGMIMVSFTQKAGQDYKLRLNNLIGREVRTLMLKPDLSGEALSVNLSDLPSGIYFYSLLAGDKVLTTKRLVLQN